MSKKTGYCTVRKHRLFKKSSFEFLTAHINSAIHVPNLRDEAKFFLSWTLSLSTMVWSTVDKLVDVQFAERRMYVSAPETLMLNSNSKQPLPEP